MPSYIYWLVAIFVSSYISFHVGIRAAYALYMVETRELRKRLDNLQSVVDTTEAKEQERMKSLLEDINAMRRMVEGIS